MNGRLTRGSNTERDKPVVFASSMEIPVTPPSMKLLDNKNPFKPMLAEKIPSPMSRAFTHSGNKRFMASLARIHRRGFSIRGGPAKLDCGSRDLRDDAQNFATAVWPRRGPWVALSMRADRRGHPCPLLPRTASGYPRLNPPGPRLRAPAYRLPQVASPH